MLLHRHLLYLVELGGRAARAVEREGRWVEFVERVVDAIGALAVIVGREPKASHSSHVGEIAMSAARATTRPTLLRVFSSPSFGKPSGVYEAGVLAV
jgi:hypothetical protein